MLVKFSIGAGQRVEFSEAGDFFRLLEAAQPVTVFFYRGGKEEARAEGITGGYAEQFGDGFDRVVIMSATAQTVQMVTRLGNVVSYDAPPKGAVTVENLTGTFYQGQATVTNASAVLRSAKTNRRYLLIQNNDQAGDIFVTLDTSAATAAKGIKIAPGGSLELSSFCPSGEVRAIGSIASNANVVVVEG